MIDFRNKEIEIYPYNAATQGIVVKNARKANKLNKYLKYYDCTIKDGEEPLFKVNITQMRTVLILLGLTSLKNSV